MFLMELLGEFHDLKSQFLENEELISKGVKGRTIEEKTMNLISWFMHYEMPDKPKSTISFDKADKRTKSQKETGKRIYDGQEKQKAILIDSIPEDVNQQTKFGCKISILVGYGNNEELNTINIITKEEVDYQFQYLGQNKVIKE